MIIELILESVWRVYLVSFIIFQWDILYLERYKISSICNIYLFFEIRYIIVNIIINTVLSCSIDDTLISKYTDTLIFLNDQTPVCLLSNRSYLTEEK